MMKLALIFKLFLIILFSAPSFAAENSLGKIFDEYQKSYQANDFDSAKNIAEEALQSHTHNSYLIYNLGLTEYKLGRVGTAIGLWRKALYSNPRLKQASDAIDYAVSQLPTKPLTKNTDSTWSWINGLITKNLSFNYIWPVCLIFFVISGMGLIKHYADKKRAFENDEPAPIITNKAWTAICIFALLITVSTVSFLDHTTTKATAISKPTQVKTGPSLEFGTLFEIPEGTEVLIRDNEGEWYKIEDPTGRLGWIADDQLLITTM